MRILPLVGRLIGLTILLAGAAVSHPSPGEAAQTPKQVFERHAEPAPGLKSFPKWTGALERYFEEKRQSAPPCNTGKCPLKDWYALIKENEGQDRDRMIKNVNRELNRMPYVVDMVNWGVEDYWEAPAEFYAKFGDCEDYAITKYLTLRALGFQPDEMLITAVQDLNLRVGHAILIVFLNGSAFVLDNQIKLIVEDRKVKHYKPIYGINEEGWWKFK